MAERMDDKDVQVKRALCPKCKQPVLVGVLHHLTSKDLREYEKLQTKRGCELDIIPLTKHREDNVDMCFLNCTPNPQSV